MKRRNREKNFISYWKLCILAGMLFFFMVSSSIPVHAEGLDDSGEYASGPSGEADSSGEGEKEKDVAAGAVDSDPEKNESVGDVQSALKENDHTNNDVNEAGGADGDDDEEDEDELSEDPDGEEHDDGKKGLDEEFIESDLEIVVEEAPKSDGENAEEKQITKLPMVDAPEIAPEPGDNNVFGVAGQYYVSVPKSMAFRKLANGDFETLQSSYYTVNSGLEPGYKLSVRVSGDQGDEAVQLSNETGTVHRKVEVSTMACDIWQYRPDGTVLTVNEADESGYGKELVLDGPGKFKAKCRLQKYADDVLNAGTWSGSILFTVTCTPEPEEKVDSTAEEVQTDTDVDADTETETQETKRSAPVRRVAPQPVQQPTAEEPTQTESADTVTEEPGDDPQGVDTEGVEDIPEEIVEAGSEFE